ncbi:hypothetical protein [Tardiphaga sp. 841_E9_N1_2]|uniref:hypothetical protein n=1 Tax=Tardiphaga sp. 841_E9_N1_2 TaxID=3240762 RepID=UPI003F26388A
MNRTDKKALPKAGDKVVRMYPNNGLKQPVRKYKDTFSAIDVVKEMFFKKESAKA